MKKRLLAFTPPAFLPVSNLTVDFPSSTRRKWGFSGLAHCCDTASVYFEKMGPHIKTHSIFPFSSGLQYNSDTIAGIRLIFHLSKSNV